MRGQPFFHLNKNWGFFFWGVDLPLRGGGVLLFSFFQGADFLGGGIWVLVTGLYTPSVYTNQHLKTDNLYLEVEDKLTIFISCLFVFYSEENCATEHLHFH